GGRVREDALAVARLAEREDGPGRRLGDRAQLLPRLVGGLLRLLQAVDVERDAAHPDGPAGLVEREAAARLQPVQLAVRPDHPELDVVGAPLEEPVPELLLAAGDVVGMQAPA